ncbi:MAG: hypothetical protein ACPH5S_01315, partial [Candidatus Poseidoniaceae archaeon]
GATLAPPSQESTDKAIERLDRMRHAKGTAFFQPSACFVHVSVVGRGVIIMALLAPMRSNVPPSTKRHALHGDGDH